MITKNITSRCHSGGAVGADIHFEYFGALYGVKTLAYSYQTPYHKSINKVEISEADFQDGIEKIALANQSLKRKINVKHLNLLARNWQQIKNTDQVFAVSKIIFKNIECVWVEQVGQFKWQLTNTKKSLCLTKCKVLGLNGLIRTTNSVS